MLASGFCDLCRGFFKIARWCRLKEQIVKNPQFLAKLAPKSTKRTKNYGFLTICPISLHHRAILKNLDRNRKIRLLTKFWFGLVPKMLSFEIPMTSASYIFFALNSLKNAQISWNLPILLLQLVKEPKRKICTVLPYKPSPFTIFGKSSIRIVNSTC